MVKYCIQTRNYCSDRVVFTEDQRSSKGAKHPELREEGFIERVRQAIEKPDFVYQDLANYSRHVYYRYEYTANGRDRYVKVVIETSQEPYFVITAYRPDFIKEEGKTKLIYKNDH